MSNIFPTYLRSSNTGDIGVNLVSKVVNDDMKFIFKRNNGEYDFGIDAYIEIVTENGSVTGQVIAAQIKCGESFFKTKTKTGFTFYGENKHLNYYCNAPFPVIIIICDPESRECYWDQFLIEKTEKTDKNWKINIPRRNKFSSHSKDALLELVGDPVDFLGKASEHWEMIKALKVADYVHYSVSRKDIESLNVKPLAEFIKRILSNDELSIRLQGKIVVSVEGYFFDKRELWEIREVRRWAKKAEPKIKYWFFFCANPENNTTLTWLLTCLTNVISVEVDKTNKNKLKIEYETKPLAEIIMLNFLHLNELTEKYDLPIEENQRISNDSVLALGFSLEDAAQPA
ncbi:DUF4365 domain-containing protein [Methylomonas fluvii]|uniref:DUF4365 and DUF1817 domain-containing protein n=1 Tax=Methylomonas fluvii TaxID=1854564 RepID=A0ABR9DFD7_9GAMM|nr:DUF4365 and DUF1817 domain-containing protein [Methylomonas fluvii]MBD9361660.1 DUF4365 and DUF1817 domain-containing protein [Methylomonas fluvii]